MPHRSIQCRPVIRSRHPTTSHQESATEQSQLEPNDARSWSPFLSYLSCLTTVEQTDTYSNRQFTSSATHAGDEQHLPHDSSLEHASLENKIEVDNKTNDLEKWKMRYLN